MLLAKINGKVVGWHMDDIEGTAQLEYSFKGCTVSKASEAEAEKILNDGSQDFVVSDEDKAFYNSELAEKAAELEVKRKSFMEKRNNKK